jgi:hypothetical protein
MQPCNRRNREKTIPSLGIALNHRILEIKCFFQGDFAELTGGLILFMVHSVFKNHGHQHQENLWNAYGKDVCSAWPFFFLPAARR